MTAGDLRRRSDAGVVEPVEIRTEGEGRPMWNSEVLDGPLTAGSLRRVDGVLRRAQAATGLIFSVYIGHIDGPTRETAEWMHSGLAEPERSVLIALSPNQRLLEIVTGSHARTRILNRDARLAAMSMSTAFAGGDLSGGIVAGVAQLADYAGPGSTKTI